MPRNSEHFYSSENKELFYSEHDKRLFWVAGYTDNAASVDTHVKMLIAKRDIFLEMCGLPADSNIKSEYVTKSSRYKSMRYFWVDGIEISKVPETAFRLGSDWTMMKWIEN
jgi:hypothetical protein